MILRNHVFDKFGRQGLRWLLWAFVSQVLFVPAAFADTAASWRSFTPADGLPENACVALTINPAGKVLVTHRLSGQLSQLDGYTVVQMPAPGGRGRVYESAGGQLWAAAPDGLLEYREGGWIRHRLAQVAERQGEPVGPLSLCPVRQGLVLFLLPDGLWQLTADNAGEPVVECLLKATPGKVGQFRDMTASRDGGLWIAAEKGLAKAAGPLRALKGDSVWEYFPIAPDLGIKELSAPHEDAAGITVMANGPGDEVLVGRFSQDRWSKRSANGRRLLHAWHGPDGALWAATAEGVWRWDEERGELVPVEDIPIRRCHDVAVEPGGSFWVATSDGLFRFCLLPWQSPPLGIRAQGAVRSLASDDAGRLWFVAGQNLHSVFEEQHHEYPLPPGWAESSGAISVYAVRPGQIWLSMGGQVARFDIAAGSIRTLPLPAGGLISVLGQQRDQLICAQVLDSSATNSRPATRLLRFDGGRFSDLPDPPDTQALGSATALLSARNGDLWLAGDQATVWFHEKKWRVFGSGDGTSPEGIIAFAELADGRIWGATQDKIWEFNGKEWNLVRRGLDRIRSLVASREGSVWVASGNGLARYYRGAWIANGPADGLPQAIFWTLYEDSHGQLWAGTGRGLSRYVPSADSDPPRTQIYPPDETERTLHEGAGLTLRFGGQDKWKLTSAERLQYSFRLDEHEWSPFQEVNGVSFGDFAPGKHFFQVRALDRNGNLDPAPAQYDFAVLLPWYREGRLLAIAVAGLTVALFFAGVAWNRHRRLVRSYAEIERKVTERTRQLEVAHRELFHSQKMNALGTLAAGIAHDFNNILSIIKGSAQIIEDNLANPHKVQTRVDRIKTVVEQGAGIVKAMLGFSRESDEGPGPCDPNSLVQDTLKLLGDRFLREIQVHFEPGEGLPQARASRDLVQQILLNFILNAAEALRDRNEIIISVARTDRLPAHPVLAPAGASEDGGTPGIWVTLSVRDFGTGMAPEILPRIFEPFFTTKAMSARRGTGLGLSMVYELARKLGAGLAVQSELGQGSTFTLILPAVPPETKTAPAALRTHETAHHPDY